MDTRNPRGVANLFPATWNGIGYIMEEDRVDGRGRKGMSHRNSHSLDERESLKSLHCLGSSAQRREN
ncbi:hypothetical protein EVAR_68663_1 [Eumeta japonica]|uniref:Uncharacterized protein n=1 Tax=Eumeta variegata TaxID=151549 RepID=A0A4C2A001_EUMVA|nr:hypothetical protein EVAR_68663_1 [Eumeta japonica]